MNRKLLLAVALVAVFLVGGAIGFAVGERHDRARLVPLVDSAVAMYAGFRTSGERLYGTEATYEDALRQYVNLLDNLEARNQSESSRRAYAADKALALIRLADLAEKRGESAESTRLTSDAVAACATRGLPYCTSADLHRRAWQFDMIFERSRESK